jgi:putative membrane protein insertion efficiency factor
MRLERTLCIGLIRVYQYGLSPLLPRTCRYGPTCSEYAREAIERHGVLFGCWLAARRLLRCHPWGGHGYDPVPERVEGPLHRLIHPH